MRAESQRLWCSCPCSGAASSRPCPRVNLEKRTQETRKEDMAKYVVMQAVGTLLPVIVEWIFDEARRRKEAKTRESQDSTNKVDDMREDLKKILESTKHELQLLRELLEKNQGKKEDEIGRALESMMEKLMQNNNKRFLTREQKLKKSQESTKSELQLIRTFVEEALGKKEDEIARAPESKMEKELKHLFQRIENLEQDLQKSKKDTERQLQLFSRDLEDKLVKKEEETLRALESIMEKKFDQFLKRIHNPEGDLQKSQESTQRQLSS